MTYLHTRFFFLRSTSFFFLCFLGSTLWFSLPQKVQANPFFVGRFNGLLGGPLDQSPYALYWNPANLDTPKSHLNLYLGGISRQAIYNRTLPPDTDPEIAAINGGESTTSALGVVPSLLFQTGWALDKDYRFGIGGGFYVSRAGTANWNRRPDQDAQYPGGYDGAQRWSALSTSMALLNWALGFSMGMGPFSIGVAGNYVQTTLSTTKASNLDKSDAIFTPDGDLKEGRIWLDQAKGEAFHLNAGLRFDYHPFQIAFAWRQNVTYNLIGTAHILSALAETKERAKVPLQVAGNYHLTMAYFLTKTLRLRGEYEFMEWSIMDEQEISNATTKAQLMVLDRQFNDTQAYRLRLDWTYSPAVSFHTGLSYEEAATPIEYHEAGLAENDQVEVGVGATWALSSSLSLHSTFFWQHFMDRTVTQSLQKPQTNGSYTDQRQYLIFNLDWTF
jgi:long-subunit fatty acid transport protein